MYFNFEGKDTFAKKKITKPTSIIQDRDCLNTF